MKFNVYVLGADKRPEPLGSVDGRHQPDALGKAWKRWPKRILPQVVQAGFIVLPAAKDPYAKSI